MSSIKKPTIKKLIVVSIIGLILFLSYIFELHQYLNLSYLKENIERLKEIANNNPVLFGSLYFLGYVVITGVSIPGAAILTLGAGALFGIVLGTILVSFASTTGATLAFIVSRYVLGDYVRKKFPNAMKKIDAGIKREGKFYLFALRLAPYLPFFVINLGMGLTNMRAFTFFWVSQVGMIPGTIAYVNAGMQLSTVDSTSDILSMRLIISFAILGLLPLIAKKVIEFIRRQKAVNQ